ncbi:MAG: hypothetical protein ABFD50_19360 [Smithella sp.]
MKITYILVVVTALLAHVAQAQDKLAPTACLKEAQLEKRIENIKKNKIIYQREVIDKNSLRGQEIKFASQLIEFDELEQKTRLDLELVQNDCAIALKGNK